ncbi:MAG TPA: flagellar biosynthetic protein FliQ [Terriglobales bacterium]|nr:flagellar biosynthetic protein FliQ [Terriglobales bacterium]
MMSMQLIVDLGRTTLETALIVGAPLLILVMLLSLLINIVQVLTSLQDITLSTVPRLAVVGIASLLLMPWMLRRLAVFTLQLFSDFRPLLH